MDAQGLVRTTRRELAEGRSVAAVLAEAWQACRLVEAVARLLLAGFRAQGPPGTGEPGGRSGTGGLGSGGLGACGGEAAARAEIAAMLMEAGVQLSGSLEPSSGDAPAARAERADRVERPIPVLRELRVLVDEMCEALLAVACGAHEQELYWRCVDTVDAAAECRDLIGELLRVSGGGPAPGADGGAGGDGGVGAGVGAGAAGSDDGAGRLVPLVRLSPPSG